MRYKKPPIPNRQLLERIKVTEKFEGFKFTRTGQNKGYWIGRLQPTPESEIYTIKIVYNNHSLPDVFVLNPNLLDSAPHTYPDKSLCLYYPRDKSYNFDSFIAETIIPWTAEWLYFYEGWVNEGIWWGDEAPHPIPNLRTS